MKHTIFSPKSAARPFVLAACLFAGTWGGTAWADSLRTDQPTLYAELEYSMFTPFLEALAQGDLQVIKQFLAPRHYARYQTLLERNPEYPEFLRKHYAGASFQLNDISTDNGNYVGQVTVYWGDGRQSDMQVPLMAPAP